MDLGSVVREHDNAVRAAKKGTSVKSGSRSGARQAALGPAAAGPQIRPKRRMPVSKVGGRWEEAGWGWALRELWRDSRPNMASSDVCSQHNLCKCCW